MIMRCSTHLGPYRSVMSHKIIPLLRKRAQSTVSSEVLGHRDLFVFDSTWSLQTWAAMTTAAQFNMRDTNKNLKHPKSGHVISKYATYQFENSAYHFNNVGEYYLNVTAAHSFSPTFIRHVESKIDEDNIKEGTHSVVIWPDSLLVQSASADDVEAITDMVSDHKRKISYSQAMNYLTSRNKGEKSKLTVEEVPNMMAIVACGTAEFPNAADRLKNLYKTSESLLPYSVAEKVPPPVFFMAADMRGHRNASKIMIMSSGSDGEALEDCLGDWEGGRAGAVLQNHLTKAISSLHERAQ